VLKSVVGDNARDGDGGKARETLDAVGVFAGDDFVGEIDLARSDGSWLVLFLPLQTCSSSPAPRGSLLAAVKH
jgi:hypothetical protein